MIVGENWLRLFTLFFSENAAHHLLSLSLLLSDNLFLFRSSSSSHIHICMLCCLLVCSLLAFLHAFFLLRYLYLYAIGWVSRLISPEKFASLSCLCVYGKFKRQHPYKKGWFYVALDAEHAATEKVEAIFFLP